MRGITTRQICAIAAFLLSMTGAQAQTTSTQTGSDGNWATAANWNNGVPGGNWTANVNKNLTLNTNISVSGGGRYNINSPVTDNAGGTAYTLSLSGSGSNGIFDVFANTVFEGAATINSKGELIVEPGCTLTVGAATFANGSIVNVKAGGTLIINGNLTNNNNSDEITINGSLIVNGSFTGGNGSAIIGAGTVSTTGGMTTSGSGTVFGQPASCSTGPCSSATLCGTNTITPTSSTICSGTSPGIINGSSLSGYSYKWQSATGAAGPWTDLNTVSTANRNYTPGSLTANTYFRRYASNGTCTSYSTPSLITVQTTPAITSQPSSQSRCVGGSVTFSVTATGSSLSYQWKKNGSNVGTNSSSYTIASVTSGDAASYTVVVSNTGCGNVTSSAATLTISTTSTWSGAVNTNWSTAGNWSCGIVPSNALDISIPSGLTNYPVVPAATSVTVKNITIASGASLTLTSSTSSIQVYGNWSNNGIFTANNGTIVFAGTSAQSIAGSNTTTFHNLTVSNTTAAVSLGHDENLSGTLTLNANTTFTATGYELVLISNAAGTGRIGAVPASATYNGNIRMQRYIPAINDRLWYTLAAPVNGATVAQWQASAPTGGFYVTGPFTGASTPGNGINPSGVSAYSWVASTGTWLRYPASSNTEAVVPGNAYRVFVRDGNATYNAGATTSKTFSVAGAPTIGNHTYTLNYAPTGGTPAGGWNLIGNPYPSDISVNLSGGGWINVTNLDGFATYTWDSDGKSYMACNGGIGTCVVPSSQGFWVKVLPGGGSITATENVKATSSLAIYKVAYGQPNYIPVKLVNGTTSENDVLYIRFENDATTGFDNQYDAYKLTVGSSGVVNNSVSLYSKLNGVNYSILANPLPISNDTLPLIINAPIGNHSIDFSDDSHITSEFSYSLIDRFTNTVTNLRKTAVYNFSITSDAASYQDRFFVVFNYKEPQTNIDTDPNLLIAGTDDQTESAEINVYPNPVATSTGSIQITLPESLSGTIEINVVDAQGILIHSEKRTSATSMTLSFEERLKEGMYMIIIQSEGKQFRKKIIAR